MEHGSQGGKKPTGQRHMKTKPNPRGMKGTMGTGKSKMKVKGAMGKNQSTGTGEAF